MTRGIRSGRTRGCLGAAFGGLWGVATTWIVGAIEAPIVNPASPLEHEWYATGVLFVLPIPNLILGALIGSCAVFAREQAGRRAWAWGAVGWFLGLAAGWMIMPREGEAGPLACHCFLALGASFVGLAIATDSVRGAEGCPTE